MNAKPMTVASTLALGVALAASGASAQTVISRTVTAEPVETVVTQTPTGTVVTRRPVDAAVPGPAVAPAAIEAVAPAGTVVETVPDTVDAITTREVVRRAEATRARPALVTRAVSARTEPRLTRKLVRKTMAPRTAAIRAAPRLALTPRERHIVYQTIVEREVIPRRDVVVTQPIAPAPYVAPAPYAPAPLVTRQVGLPVAPAPLVADDEVVVQAPIAVGTVLPANTPLYAMPQNVALSVPAARAYSYAWLGGRAYLVDPATGVVMADLTE